MSNKKIDYNKCDNTQILAKTLYFEAGSTLDILEILYIGYVIRNRVEGHKWYGSTYAEVCLKKYQFSCWNNKTLEEIEAIDLNGRWRWAMCLMIAEYIQMIPKNKIPKQMHRVYHYVNSELVSTPGWAEKMDLVYPEMHLVHTFFKS